MIQNLNENRAGDVIGSIFYHGRSWHEIGRRELKFEWCLGKHATQCHAHLNIGADENNDGVQVSFSIPWLFSIYMTLCGVWKWKREYEFGFGIHNTSFWLYTGHDPMGGWSRSNAWWDKTHSWGFPWEWNHHKTEILEHKANLPGFAKTVYVEPRKRSLGDGSFDIGQRYQKDVSETYDYTYALNNGEVQHRKATVYVDRMTWRMKWWPILPFSKSRTSINVSFDGEVGEKTGSWKGGCTGCGMDMLPGETPLETLRRMEKTRKF